MSFIASLTFCDNASDVADAADKVIRMTGEEFPDWSDLEDLREILAAREVKTLHNTSLAAE